MTQLIHRKQERLNSLAAELAAAKEALLAAERALAEEQAAVNAFRMHCRLTIGPWVDALMDLRSERQVLLTRLRLLRQELGLPEPEIAESPHTPPHPEDDYELPDAAPVLAMVDAIARDYAAEKRLYRELARRFHPDVAANVLERAYATTMMAAVNVAYEQGDVQTLRELAGEPDPTAVAALNQIEDRDVRRLQEQVMACQRRHRKVAQQLRAHRAEYTAQLWRKATHLDTSDEQNWWEEIQQVLAREIACLETAVAALRGEVATLETQVEAMNVVND